MALLRTMKMQKKKKENGRSRQEKCSKQNELETKMFARQVSAVTYCSALAADTNSNWQWKWMKLARRRRKRIVCLAKSCRCLRKAHVLATAMCQRFFIWLLRVFVRRESDFWCRQWTRLEFNAHIRSNPFHRQENRAKWIASGRRDERLFSLLNKLHLSGATRTFCVATWAEMNEWHLMFGAN